jgi:[acyl-carrier-protein] S-malonyltransferase
MQPAAERLSAELAKIQFRDPSVPVIANVDAAPNTDGARVRELLVQQVTAPVRWEQSIQRLDSMQVSRAVEIGQGTVLAGLVKRITRAVVVQPAGDPASIAALTTAASVDGEPTNSVQATPVQVTPVKEQTDA